ncbi:MAG: DegT/DnrJ/EryC1/StrS family aminotransferase [Gammaproteobacteria bacterium]
MTQPFIPFARPCIDDATIADVVATLKSGWITTGPKVQAFEEALAAYCGAPFAQAVTSGTAALHLSLLACDIGPGDEVITTPFTFAATVNTIALVGAKPVFVDIDHSLNMNLDLVEAAITPRTKAIMPVHFAGQPMDCDKLYDIAKRHGLRVIEDGAHAIGATFAEKRLGSFGDIQIFSFHPNKNMTTGEGGLITSRDPAFAARVSRLRFHGIDREVWNRFTAKGSQHYDVAEPGFKYNMMDLQAAIGLHQIKHLDAFIDARTAWVNRYQEALKDVPGLTWPTQKAQGKHAWHLLIAFVTAPNLTRDDFMQQLKDKGVGTGLHYQAVHRFSYYQKTFGYKDGDFPIAEWAADHVVSLPLYPHLELPAFERITETIQSTLQESVICPPLSLA